MMPLVSEEFDLLVENIKTALDRSQINQTKSMRIFSILIGFSQLLQFLKLSKENNHQEHLVRAQRNVLSALDFLKDQIGGLADEVKDEEFQALMEMTSEANLMVSKIVSEIVSNEK